MRKQGLGLGLGLDQRALDTRVWVWVVVVVVVVAAASRRVLGLLVAAAPVAAGVVVAQVAVSTPPRASPHAALLRFCRVVVQAGGRVEVLPSAMAVGGM